MWGGDRYCSYCGRSCSCSTAAPDVYVVTSATDYFDVPNTWGVRTTTERLAEFITAMSDSLDAVRVTNAYGWWNTFRPDEARQLRQQVRPQPTRPRRAQARACRVDRNRWKRRRFLHSLRRTA